MSFWWKAQKKLGECKDWEAFDKEEKQAKKDYYETSDCVLEIGYLLGSNRVQREYSP